MKVGVLEILSESISLNMLNRAYDAWFRRHFASITPQAVAVWCRQLGHSVCYATYYGQQDPRSLLPDSLDVVFIATCTNASAIAYALAKLFRREKTLTVIGGAHARSFPLDCLRFFDFVVQDCDKILIDVILRGSYDRKTIVSSGRPLEEIPSVRERLPEISISQFTNGQPTRLSWIPILSSLGCPYSCDFCVDWENPYALLPLERLAADLNYISKHLRGVLIQYHDPNFGVKFDQVLETIETIPNNDRNPYIMTCSLSVLQGPRLKRLKESNCVFALIGLESWADYSKKAGVGSSIGEKKLEKVIAYLEELRPYVQAFQVTLLFGTDMDKGDEPVKLTKEFIRRVPFVWPVINIPIPFGCTPLFESYLADGRILRSMPFSFYCSPYLTTTLKNYHPLEYYQNWIEINKVATSPKLLIQRISSSESRLQKFLLILRTLSVGEQLLQLRRLRKLLITDKELRAFHEGRTNELPKFYRRLYRKKLGRYGELISEVEMIPELETY